MATIKDILRQKKKSLHELRASVKDLEMEIENLTSRIISNQVKEKISQERMSWMAELTGLNRWIILASLCEEKIACDIGLESTHISLIGKYPWDVDELHGFLSDKGFQVSGELSDCEILIVGNNDCDEAKLYGLISDALHDNRPLRIYTQELFLYWLISGEDPLHTWQVHALLESVENHNGMRLVLSYDELRWPNEITYSDDDSVVRIDASEWSGESLLHKMGYTATDGILNNTQRRSILERFFKEPIGGLAKYTNDFKKWGNPGSPQRLYAISAFISWLIGFQGNHKPNAADKWISDLQWLKDNFYNNRMKFSWPKKHNVSVTRNSGNGKARITKNMLMAGADEILYELDAPRLNVNVFHKKFGWGKIVKINDQLGRHDVVIDFEKVGKKELVFEFSDLKTTKSDLRVSVAKKTSQIISAPLIKPIF
jgi:hypothetical protein